MVFKKHRHNKKTPVLRGVPEIRLSSNNGNCIVAVFWLPVLMVFKAVFVLTILWRLLNADWFKN